MKHSPSLRQKWLNMGIVFLLKPDGGLKIQFPKEIMNPDLAEEIKAHKPKIINWLLQEKKPDCQQINLQDLSSEQIADYLLLLEESYRNPDNDPVHGNDTPQHFRNGTHTYDMMAAALEKFIHQKQKEESFPFNFTKNEIEIIGSYPPSLHSLLTTLLDVRNGKYTAISLRQQELENFRHNMQWLFVSIEYYIKGWHPADVRTLWSDGWRAHDIVCFMASQKVKYILCHNDKIIQCLDLNNGVYVFEKKRSSLSEHKPVEETS